MFLFQRNLFFKKAYMGDIYFSRTHQPNPQAVIAGTFCLMSCTMQSGGALYLSRIIDNFNFLADCETLEPQLRTLCRRMACHWESTQAETFKGLAQMPQQDETQPFVVDLVDAPAQPNEKHMSAAEALTYANAFLLSLRTSAL
jgi:hypothetical protein